MAIIKTKLRINISDHEIDHIIELAVPGMKIWCSKVMYVSVHTKSKCVHKGTLNDKDAIGRILLHMSNNDQVFLYNKWNDQYYCLSKQKIIKGIKKILHKEAKLWTYSKPYLGLYSNIPYINTYIATYAVQYGLFGKIIYKMEDSH